MNISTVGSSILGSTVQSGSSAGGFGRLDNDGDSDRGRTQNGRRGGGQLLNALAQTLSQLGIGTLGQAAVPPVTSAMSASTNNDTDSSATATGQSIGQVLHRFVHALFQALGSGSTGNAAQAQGQAPAAADSDGDTDGSGSAAGVAKGANGYGDLATRLQNLIQSLSSGTGTSSEATGGNASGSTSDLNAAFQDLVKVLQGNNGSSSSSSIDLQTFLKTFAQNLQSSGTGAVGNLVATTA